ncbi:MULTISPECIES: hypothetical protein [unclassified Flagellimonas]|uniref:Uncharacterized protein n=1 Tax=Flagellimonas sp. MMG031 TaxID=3158549 RepID=A0AAU7MXL3_9FLAO
MRLFVACIILLGAFLSLNAQAYPHPQHGSNFYSSESYSVASYDFEKYGYLPDSTLTYNKEEHSVYLLKEQDTINEIGSFPISELHYSDFYVWINESPGINGVERVILVDHLFSNCGDSLTSYYFLEMSDGSIDWLPTLTTMNLGDELHYYQYRFPNEKFGVKDKVVQGFLDLTQASEFKSFEKETVFLWDGKKLIPEQ